VHDFRSMNSHKEKAGEASLECDVCRRSGKEAFLITKKKIMNHLAAPTMNVLFQAMKKITIQASCQDKQVLEK
jgi:hypothetical protein